MRRPLVGLLAVVLPTRAGCGGANWRRPAATLAAVVALVAIRAVSPLVVALPSVPAAPAGAAAPAAATLEEPTATQLLLDGEDGLTRVDLDARTTQAVPAPPAAPGVAGSLVRREGAMVVVRGGMAWATDPSGRPAARLGVASYALAAADPRQVWLVEETGDPERWYRVRELTLDGRQQAAGALALGVRPAAGVPGGLLVTVTGPDTGLAVWQPGRGLVGRRLPAADPVLVAVRGGLVAWADGPVLRLTDLVGGLDRTVAAPAGSAGFAAAAGAFSPDGRMLAAFTGLGDTIQPALALVAVDRASAVPVGGSEGALADRCSPCLAWAPAGDWVFFNRLGPGFAIGAYRLGRARAVTVPVEVPGSLPPSLAAVRSQ